MAFLHYQFIDFCIIAVQQERYPGLFLESGTILTITCDATQVVEVENIKISELDINGNTTDHGCVLTFYMELYLIILVRSTNTSLKPLSKMEMSYLV